MRLPLLWIVPCLAFVAAGCGARPRVPVVTPQSTQVTGVVSGGLAVRIDLLIYNPNGHDLTVRSMTARVEAQGTHLGDVEHAHQLNLPAGQNIPFVAEVTVPWGNLPSLAATALLSSGVPYTVRGRVQAVWQSFTVEAPFALDGVIPQSMLLRFPGGITIPGFKAP
jgi:LEA14-like dessication related protein